MCCCVSCFVFFGTVPACSFLFCLVLFSSRLPFMLGSSWRAYVCYLITRSRSLLFCLVFSYFICSFSIPIFLHRLHHSFCFHLVTPRLGWLFHVLSRSVLFCFVISGIVSLCLALSRSFPFHLVFVLCIPFLLALCCSFLVCVALSCHIYRLASLSFSLRLLLSRITSLFFGLSCSL